MGVARAISLRHQFPRCSSRQALQYFVDYWNATTLIRELNSVIQFDVEENSINPIDKAIVGRPGHIVSRWDLL